MSGHVGDLIGLAESGAVIWQSSLASFLAHNADDEETCAAVGALRPGDQVVLGGGACPQVTVRRPVLMPDVRAAFERMLKAGATLGGFAERHVTDGGDAALLEWAGAVVGVRRLLAVADQLDGRAGSTTPGWTPAAPSQPSPPVPRRRPARAPTSAEREALIALAKQHLQRADMGSSTWLVLDWCHQALYYTAPEEWASLHLVRVQGMLANREFVAGGGAPELLAAVERLLADLEGDR